MEKSGNLMKACKIREKIREFHLSHELFWIDIFYFGKITVLHTFLIELLNQNNIRELWKNREKSNREKSPR
jgi:hypothetical protein